MGGFPQCIISYSWHVLATFLYAWLAPQKLAIWTELGRDYSNGWPWQFEGRPTIIYTYYRTVCLTDPSNNQLVKDEGAQIFYSIRLQTKPNGIRANCEIPHTYNSN